MWSDQADRLITRIDLELNGKYKPLTLRALLTDPARFAETPDLTSMIGKVRADVDAYIGSRIEELGVEGGEVAKEAERCGELSRQLAKMISDASSRHDVPLITPVYVERNDVNDEAIYIDRVESGTGMLIDKLVSSSEYVAYNEKEYNGVPVGEWFLSGSKNYLLSIYIEHAEIMGLREGKEELDRLLDAAIEYVSTLKG